MLYYHIILLLYHCTLFRPTHIIFHYNIIMLYYVVFGTFCAICHGPVLSSILCLFCPRSHALRLVLSCPAMSSVRSCPVLSFPLFCRVFCSLSCPLSCLLSCPVVSCRLSCPLSCPMSIVLSSLLSAVLYSVLCPALSSVLASVLFCAVLSCPVR